MMSKANSAATEAAPVIDLEARRVASLIRSKDVFAVETMLEHGAVYFNPMICCTEEESFEKIGLVMQMIHGVLDSSEDIEGIRYGMAIVTQTVWAAAQYQSNRLSAVCRNGGES